MRTTNNNDEESARTIAAPYWELFRGATKDQKTTYHLLETRELIWALLFLIYLNLTDMEMLSTYIY